MEPGEALSTAAQIAVTLAGFAGVVVVFRRESVHDWSPVDKLRLRLLLTNSILPLVLCMIGLLFAITMTKHFRRLALREVQSEPLTRFVFYLFGTIGIAANLLQLYNAASLGAFWPFFTGIVVQLVTGMFQFARMILLRHE